MGWVDLNTLYVQKSGDTMTGSLTIPQNKTLTCYNDTTAYNVGATLASLQSTVNTIYTVVTGSGTLDTSQLKSGGWCTWKKMGKVVCFEFYAVPLYYQSSYDTSPAWMTSLPKNSKGGNYPCGVGLIDGKDSACLMTVDGKGQLKCIRRNATINANTPIQGFGAYIEAQ